LLHLLWLGLGEKLLLDAPDERLAVLGDDVEVLLELLDVAVAPARDVAEVEVLGVEAEERADDAGDGFRLDLLDLLSSPSG
jgi:hypothetical protein